MGHSIKYLEEQLYHIHEKLESVYYEYKSSVMNHKNIENASEISFEQHSIVTTTNASIEQTCYKTKMDLKTFKLPFSNKKALNQKLV